MTKIWVISFEPVTHVKFLWKLLMCPPEMKCFALQLNISLTCSTSLTSCKYVDNIIESLISRLKVNTLCLIYCYPMEQSKYMCRYISSVSRCMMVYIQSVEGLLAGSSLLVTSWETDRLISRGVCLLLCGLFVARTIYLMDLGIDVTLKPSLRES